MYDTTIENSLTKAQVCEGSAAEQIGIRNGDMIESLNG
jgi:hypothetical protein